MMDVDLYKINKSTKVGNEIICPTCRKHTKKRQYSQAFCCTKCKDKYWNYVRNTKNKYFSYLRNLGTYRKDPYDDLDLCLGDPECESLSHITIDPECDNEYIDYEFIY